jgi:hypothetical protein
MKHVMCTFHILDDGAAEPKMSKRIPCHLIFNIKMDFTRKARFVAGGMLQIPHQVLLLLVSCHVIACG